MCSRSTLLGCAVVLLWPALLGAQSAATLSARIRIDANLDDYTAVEAAFLNAPVCDSLAVVPCPEEEPQGDSAWSALQDVEQIVVTWDATHLYLGVSARVADHALMLFIDHRAGGMHEAANMRAWRRALRFGRELRPDAFIAVHDGARVPELFLVTRTETLQQVDPEEYDGVANFEADAPGRAVEVAIPWSVLFPEAELAVNPDSLAPSTPMFVLPEASSQQGLRLAAVAVHALDALGAADVAPDPSAPVPLDARHVVDIDRAVRVAWDELGDGTSRFVDFGASVQKQTAPRFVPSVTNATPGTLEIISLETFRADAPGTHARVLFPEAAADLAFAFDVSEPRPTTLYVSATIYSMRGERVVDLVRDEARSCTPQAAPYGCFGVVARDRWNGRDRNGAPVPGGMYVLRLTAGAQPGLETLRAQRTIAVID